MPLPSLRSRFGWGLLGLALVLAALYVRTIEFGMLPTYDDKLYLATRPEVQQWWEATWRQRLLTPRLGYPVPVPTIVYYGIRRMAGVHHLTVLHSLQIGLHLLNMSLVALLVREEARETIAWTVAALWSLHPLCVGVVAWLTNLKMLIWASAMLTAMWLWTRRCRKSTESPRWPISEVAIACLFIIALGSRPEAIVLPWILVGLSVYHRRGAWPSRTTLVLTGLMIAASLVYLPMAIQGQASVVEGIGGGTSGWWTRYYRITRALELAARHIVVPISLDPEYYVDAPGHWSHTIPGLMLAGGTLALIAGLALRRQTTLLAPLVLAAVLYLPYSQIKLLPRLTADSYLYLPGVPLIYAMVSALDRWLRSHATGPFGLSTRTLAIVLLLGVISSEAALTSRQVDRWRNGATLWGPVLAEHPDVWNPYGHVAHGLKRMGEWKKAASILDRGLPVLRRAREYPSFLPEIYDRAGRPERALELAREMMQRQRDGPSAAHELSYLEILVRHDVSSLSASDRWHARRALERYMSNQYWLRRPSHTLEVAAYARERDMTEPIVETLKRMERRSHPPCLAWRVADRLESPARRDVMSSTRPPRCHDSS